MGRNKGSKTGVIVTISVRCQQCGNMFETFGKRRPDGPHPAKFCTPACYHASQKGMRPTGFIGKGGAPKGRIPWNKGKTRPELSGERNGMYGKTHPPEVRNLLARLASEQMSELTRSRIANAQVPMRRSDPEYSRLFRIGWRTIRRKALERDDHACQMCGARPERITVHHITPFGLVLKHELENLITLCEPCHSRVHRQALDLSAGLAEPVLKDVLHEAEDVA